MAEPAEVAVYHLTKDFDRFRAVDDLTLEVRKGEFVALLGPSGCGKTTVLRTVAGFVAPTAGSVSVRGADITHAPPHRRPTAMVFQNYALFPHLTVGENVGYGLRMRRVPPAERARRVAAGLERVQLPGLAERFPRQLSGGQQQRVALARALVIEPDVLLLDEPLSNLDAKLRSEMRGEIRDLVKQSGTTAIYVTHDQEEALSMADRVAVMNRGRVAQVGAPRDLYEQPADLFVANFLGAANVLAGTVADVQGREYVVEIRDGTHVRVAAPVGAFRPGQPAAVVVRPERVRLARRGEADTGPVLSGRIHSASFVGAAIHYLVRLEGEGELRAQLMAGALDVGVGEPVEVTWDPAYVRLLPIEPPA